MKCSEVVSRLGGVLRGDELIVSSNGHISRVAYHALPRPQLYLRGSMGLPMAVGFGLALSRPQQTVIVLTGDGNFLMGLSSIATISHLSPPNLKIVILDNEAYATTGGQETVSTVVGYPTLFRGMGIATVESVDRPDCFQAFDKLLLQIIREPGLRVLHIKIEKDTISLENIPWHPIRIHSEFAKRFQIIE